MGDQAAIATGGVAGGAVACSICTGLSGDSGLGAAVPGTPAWSVAATRMAGAETVPAARVPAAACSAAVGVVPCPWKKGVVLRLKGEVPVTVANGLTWRKEKLELIPGL